MSDLCEHETFRDICGICHRDGVITLLTAKIAALRQARIDALEEAAKVISEMPRTHTTVKMCDVMGMKAEVTLTLNNGPAECAAAIRAMIKEG